MRRSTRETRGSLLRRLERLEERVPKPEPRDNTPWHPDYTAFLVAWSTTLKHLIHPRAGDGLWVTTQYARPREAFVAWWGEPPPEWARDKRPAFMGRERAERAADLVEAFMAGCEKRRRKKGLLLGRQAGETAHYEDTARLLGSIELEEELAEAMVGESSDPQQRHPNDVVRELACIFLEVFRGRISLDGKHKHPTSDEQGSGGWRA
jgi:hypothetical protein